MMSWLVLARLLSKALIDDPQQLAFV
jgi:hypothetical protein